MLEKKIRDLIATTIADNVPELLENAKECDSFEAFVELVENSAGELGYYGGDGGRLLEDVNHLIEQAVNWEEIAGQALWLAVTAASRRASKRIEDSFTPDQ